MLFTARYYTESRDGAIEAAVPQQKPINAVIACFLTSNQARLRLINTLSRKGLPTSKRRARV
jgi:hypothetical protein